MTDRRLGERYLLGPPLGRGGMGTVWLATDEVLQRRVAVKEVAPPAGIAPADAENLRRRVMREARAAGRLNHPNVTTVYDVLQADGRTWIVMEHVDAPTLADLVIDDGPLPPVDAARIGLGVLRALEAAHAAGIVHRDVKPSNVMVLPTGEVKLADFGVAAVAGDPKLTMTGLILGSPNYMAPEQASEQPVTPATDLWGLGATLFFAVEDRSPFDRGSAIPTLTAVAHEPPRPMHRAGPLAPVISALLSKAPADRPDAARTRALLEAVAADGTPAPAPAPVPVRAPEPAPRRRPPMPWAAALGVVALLVVGGLLLSRATPPADDTAVAGNQVQREPEPEPEAASEPAGDTDDAPAGDGVTVPDDWKTIAVGPGGATIAYPGEWEPRRLDGTRTDLVEPGTGRYLRLDWTDRPGKDAVAAWEAFEPTFARGHAGYERVRITRIDYRGYENALWEYTYGSGGDKLHAYNLAIVTGGYGYALNLQTRQRDWDDSQRLWEQFTAAFQPESG